MDRCIQLLKDLVGVDSVNPSLVLDAAGEQNIARLLTTAIQGGIGIRVREQIVAPGRPNIVAELEGKAPGRSLMFCGHIDTVGVAGMTNPFSGEERDGRIYGRGSQDMKGGIAAMVDAARVIVESGGLAAGKLIIACVVDEEHASIGADALVTKWRADGAVVTEPTDNQVAVAHKGFEWVEIETEGRAAHGSRPREGRDAIRYMGRVLNGLDAIDRQLQSRPREGRDAIRYMGRVLNGLDAIDRQLQSRPPHKLLGTASLHASLIEGGRELSSYPDRCHLQMERRTLPGEAPGAGAREVDELLVKLRGDDPDFKAAGKVMFSRTPYEVPGDHELPKAMLRAAGSNLAPIGMSFWTDAAILGDAGIPSILYGPMGAGLHSTEEWVNIASVLKCRDALVELAREWCR